MSAARVARVIEALGEALASDPEQAEDALYRARYMVARLEGEARALRLAIDATEAEIERRESARRLAMESAS